MMREKLRTLSNSPKFSAGRPLLTGYSFFAVKASTFSIYHFGAVASLKILANENMPEITVKLHIVDYCRQWISAILYRIWTKRSHKFGIGSSLKTYSPNFFLPPLKIWRAKKTQIYAYRIRPSVKSTQLRNDSTFRQTTIVCFI